MFKIIKKASGFWHVFNNGAKNVNISDFEAVLDTITQTFVIQMKNGANIPKLAVGIAQIIVIDETGSSVEETFATVELLKIRLTALGYTPYLGAGNADSITGLIEAGENVTITGAGTTSDPFVINASGGSSTTPTLQEVTNAGNVSLVPIVYEDSVGFQVETGTGDGGFAWYFKLLNIGNNFRQYLNNADNTNERWATFPDKDGTLAMLDDIPSTATFVPYTGATSDVNLGEFGLQTGNIEFDTTPTDAPTTVGSMVWNDTAGTLDLKLKGGNVTLQLGQETVARVVNKTATNITLLEANYQAVRVTGAQGQRPKVDLALANNDLNSTTTLGLVTETILNNEEGFITTSGQVQQINTTGSLQSETWADGDVLYLSGTVAGRITNIKPIAPIHTVIIGFVEYAHATQGKIFVKVDNGYELEELHNVSAIAPNNDEVLTYDSATLLWKPKVIPATPNATETVAGIAEIATTAEVATGTDDTRIVTPLKLKQVTNNYMQVILNCNVLGSTVSGGTNVVLYQVNVPANTFSDLDAFEIEAMAEKVGTLSSTTRLWVDTASTFNSGTAQLLALSAGYGINNLYLPIKREFHVRGTTVKVLANTIQVGSDEATNALGANQWASYTFNPAVANTLYFTVTGNAADTFTKQNYKITRYKNKSTI